MHISSVLQKKVVECMCFVNMWTESYKKVRNSDMNLGKKILEKKCCKPKQIKFMTPTLLVGLQKICCHGASM